MCHKNTCFLVTQEHMSSSATRKHVFLCHKTTCLLVPQEDMCSCGTRRHVFLCHKKACLLVPQADMFSCVTRGQVFLCHKKTCFLVPQEDMRPCPKTRNPEVQKTSCFNIWGRANLGPQQINNISLLYHVVPDPLNSLF